MVGKVPRFLSHIAPVNLDISTKICRRAFNAVLFILMGCLEPYEPPAILEELDLLVVEGFLDSKQGSVRVRLSKATPLSADLSTSPEQNATVSLHEENGSAYAFKSKTQEFIRYMV